MTVNELFPSKYMKAEEFAEGETKILTIKNYEVEELGQGKEKQNKPVLYFREPDAKALVLNKTNAAIIAKGLNSEDLDDWIGKKIALYVMEVQSFGDVVNAIRVKTRQSNGTVPAPRPAPEPDLFGPDDELLLESTIPDLPQPVRVQSKSKQPA